MGIFTTNAYTVPKCIDSLCQSQLNLGGNGLTMCIRGNTVNANVRHIRKSILPILRRYGVSKAGLFGSVVSSQMLPESDIDILVQIDKDISLLDFVGMKLELEEALNRNVDLVEYDTIKPLLREKVLQQQEMIL
jgi:predicted nucleotidyltransferase